MGLQNPPATLGRAMRAAVHDDLTAFSTLVPRWRALLERDQSASVFHTPQYLATWWSELGSGVTPRIVELTGDGASPSAIAPLALGADGVMRFAGDHETTDYRGPISPPEERDAVASATLESVASDPWDTFEMDGLAADTGWPEALSRAAKSAGYTVAEERTEACPRVAIPGSYDAYLQSLPGKLRHEIQRKARRLERDAGAYEIRLATEATLDDDLDRFFAMHRSSDGPKGRFMHEGMASFFGSFAWMLFSQGWLRLALLEIGGEPWAGVYAYSYRGVWGVWNSAFDHRRRELSPGMVLMGDCIRLAAEEGCATFDFLRGTEPYKYRFGASDVALIRLLVERG
jgi:CelD/BcsL family acetyltransferase involved in cellulose biosynthesis